MAGFASPDEYIEAISALAQGDFAAFHKTGTAPEAAGAYYSFWKDPGTPGAGANPAGSSGTPGQGGTQYDLTDGGLWKWADVEGGSKQRHLGELEFAATQDGTFYLYDRLVGVGGLSVASATTINVNSKPLLRYTDGENVECWLEFSTASTATVGNVNLGSYTDQDGNTGQVGTAVSFPAAATNVGTIVRMPLAAGDRGVRSVETLTINTATTAGVVNLVLMRRVATVPVTDNYGRILNTITQLTNFPRLFDGFTPMLVLWATGTGIVDVQGSASAGYR